MHLIYRPTILTKGLVCLFHVLFFKISFANELPCGERRLFKDGSELTSTYDAAYHYVESGSVTMKDGFVAKPGFSIKPSVNCSQTRPALEELIYKYAPRLVHDGDENYHMASAEWFLNRSKLMDYTDDCDLLDEDCTDPPDVICELASDCASLTNSEYRWNDNIRLNRLYDAVRFGERDSAKTYVNVQRAYYQNFPAINDYIEIQYWFFYPWNGDQGFGSNALHEGDWEHVKVIVGYDGQLKKLWASSHGDGEAYNPDDVEKENGHPIFYVANESHAIYHNKGNNQGVYDNTDGNGWVFDAWDAGRLEIVEIDPVLQNHACTPTNRSWLDYAGRWGADSKGPVGPKENRDVWQGKNTDFGHDYIPDNVTYYPESVITGEKSICYNVSYDYNIFAHFPYQVEWTAENYFTVQTSTNSVLTLQAKSNSYNASGQIRANVKLLHPNGFDIEYKNLRKNVWLGPPNTSAFDLCLDHEFTCSADASIMYNGAFDVASVDWSIAGAADLPPPNERDVYKAVLTAQHGGGGYTVYANVHNTCGSFEKSVSGTMDSSCTDPFLRIQEEQNADSVAVVQEPEPIILTDYQLFPNPTTGEVKIGLVSDGQPLTNIRTEVFNYSGRVVDRFSFEELDSPYLTLDLSSQEKGIYLVRVFQEEVPVFENKIIKQ